MSSLKKALGAIAFIAAFQFLTAVLVAESVVPGYNNQINAISELGLGSTAALFNSSVILAGVLMAVAAYMAFKFYKKLYVGAAVFVCGAGIAAVGIFPMDMGLPHTLASNIAFFLGPLIAVGSFWFTKKPYSYLFAALGIVSILAAIPYSTGIALGIGEGLLERIIVYPFLLWAMAFGLYLIASKEN